jgi:hypothetical protein
VANQLRPDEISVIRERNGILEHKVVRKKREIITVNGRNTLRVTTMVLWVPIPQVPFDTPTIETSVVLWELP